MAGQWGWRVVSMAVPRADVMVDMMAGQWGWRVFSMAVLTVEMKD